MVHSDKRVSVCGNAQLIGCVSALAVGITLQLLISIRQYKAEIVETNLVEGACVPFWMCGKRFLMWLAEQVTGLKVLRFTQFTIKNGQQKLTVGSEWLRANLA